MMNRLRGLRGDGEGGGRRRIEGGLKRQMIVTRGVDGHDEGGDEGREGTR